MLKFHNTLTGRLDEFQPLDPPRVKMYCCGPTVYNYAHIGNFRTFVFEDILNRYLRWRGYDVRYVMNVTDIDDKTIRDSAAAGMSLSAYTEKFTAAFFEDLTALRVLHPDVVCKATDHVPEMIALVEALAAKGHTYASDGSVYFKISSLTITKLSKKDFSGIQSGACAPTATSTTRRTPGLSSGRGERGHPGHPLRPRPARLAPGVLRHEHEVPGRELRPALRRRRPGVPAPRERDRPERGATGRPSSSTVRIHGFLTVNGEKMSKSKGNYFTLRDLLAKGYNPAAIRYLLLSVHYRKQLNFTEEGLRYAQASLDRIHDFVDTLRRKTLPAGESDAVAARCTAFRDGFQAGLDDDLNTSAALAALFDFIRDINRTLAEGGLAAGDRDRVLAAVADADRVLDVLPGEATGGADAESRSPHRRARRGARPQRTGPPPTPPATSSRRSASSSRTRPRGRCGGGSERAGD